MEVRDGELSLRTLTVADADLVVEATNGETARALWGAVPVGPYSWAEASAALRDWSADQVSFGILGEAVLVGAVGLMADEVATAELAYWVRPEWRRRGIGLRGVRAVTRWAHEVAGVRRVWLEINPANVASLALAERAGYEFGGRLVAHCRSWIEDDPVRDEWHDCLIWNHVVTG
jgi:RimJ/RimL family protein N-acetyltransferase